MPPLKFGPVMKEKFTVASGPPGDGYPFLPVAVIVNVNVEGVIGPIEVGLDEIWT